MPIKLGEPIDAVIGIPKSDGGMEYKKLENITSISDDTLTTDECAKMCENLYFQSKTWTGSFEIKCPNMLALYILLTTGNDLYLRFPKKLRRKRRTK